MINIPINKILFLDIETVGLCRNWEGCKESHPNIAEQFVKYFDWFLKRFPEDNVETDGLEEELQKMNDVYEKRSALVPEFAKIICVSMAFMTKDGIKQQMIINGIMPSKILPSYDTKPWEVKAIDTKEIWQYGAYTSIGSLDLVCSTMGIDTPKDGPIHGGNVHEVYWNNQSRLDEISEYCEKDVKVLVDFITKLKELK